MGGAGGVAGRRLRGSGAHERDGSGPSSVPPTLVAPATAAAVKVFTTTSYIGPPQVCRKRGGRSSC